ncbi:MAG: hypothetical protein HYY14_05675, partial [Candidatus Omnitrophica bacterium]|nr:hypothetical protein [Candidatus Omnitrophota bacterium]
GTGGCALVMFFENPDAAPLKVLRGFRDRIFRKNAWGRGLITLYYHVSDSIVREAGSGKREAGRENAVF